MQSPTGPRSVIVALVTLLILGVCTALPPSGTYRAIYVAPDQSDCNGGFLGYSNETCAVNDVRLRYDKTAFGRVWNFTRIPNTRRYIISTFTKNDTQQCKGMLTPALLTDADRCDLDNPDSTAVDLVTKPTNSPNTDKYVQWKLVAVKDKPGHVYIIADYRTDTGCPKYLGHPGPCTDIPAQQQVLELRTKQPVAMWKLRAVTSITPPPVTSPSPPPPPPSPPPPPPAATDLVGWAKNDFYTLGTASNNSYYPVKVMSGWSTSSRAISCFDSHCCGFDSDRKLWCWGASVFGQLGNGVDGNFNQDFYPVKIGSDTWFKVSTGDQFTCAINTSKKLYCWGNFNKALGSYPLIDFVLTPLKVNDANWVDISLGITHACGIQQGGTLWCWGSNDIGQAGLPSTTARQETPAQIDGASDWASVAAGGYHTCARKTSGAVFCTGGNYYGQLGINSNTTSFGLQQESTASEWSSLYAFSDHTCAIKKDTTLWCWGFNQFGEYGLGINEATKSPAQLDSGSTGWTSVFQYDAVTCALRNGKRYCAGTQFGDGYQSKVFGDGNLYNSISDFVKVNTVVDWPVCSRGFVVGCCVSGDGDLYCFGSSDDLQAARPKNDYVYLPSLVALPENISIVSVGVGGYTHTCAVIATGSLYCWGDPTAYGRFGDGSTAEKKYGVPKKIGSATWKMVSAGFDHTCAIRSAGQLYCAGANFDYQLGQGDTTTRTTFLPVGLDADWKYTASGGNMNCGIRGKDSLLNCWGENDLGQLGVGDEDPRSSPTLVGASWTMVATSGHHSCGIKKIKGDNTLWCWGSHLYGELGIGRDDADTFKNTPIQVGSATDWVFVATGSYGHTCGIRSKGGLYCWGYNAYGQCGGSPGVNYDTPNLVDSSTSWVNVFLGDFFSCAIKSTGGMYCFGENTDGRLALGTDGSPDRTPTPTRVTPGVSYVQGWASDKRAYAIRAP